MIQKTISRLRKEVDVDGGSFQHFESVRGQGYRFQNASVYEVYEERAEGDDG
jgi:DNA-binding response OmpR family regulator